MKTLNLLRLPFILTSAIALTITLTSRAWAELPEATWVEQCYATVDTQHDHRDGTASGPETVSAHSQTETGEVTASVVYNTSGPPAVTSEVIGSADHPARLFGLADGRITWHIQVVAKATPPAGVTEVPVNITASGSARASGTQETEAIAEVTIDISSSTLGNLVVYQRIAASSGASEIRSFDAELRKFSVPPNIQVVGAMKTHVHFGVGGATGLGVVNARAYVDAMLEISADPVPGDGRPYSDFFEIEYGPGFWALDPVAVESSTWGKLKTRYRE